MPLIALTHTGPHPIDMEPSSARPVRPSARDLAAGSLLPSHRHHWGQVTYASSGVLQVKADGISWIVPPQRAIWIAPEIEHEIVVLEQARLRALYVLAERAPFPGRGCKTLEVSNLLRELIAALGNAEGGAREQLLSELILDEVAGAAVMPICVPLPSDKRLAALCDAVLADPGSTLRLPDWAAKVGASERTLARLFERELGMTFGQWRQQARLAHAAPLIARGVPMAHVAESLGYASQSAFSAMFRKTFGSTPSAFFAQRRAS
jgi:AraC-like DNA-binding protein